MNRMMPVMPVMTMRTWPPPRLVPEPLTRSGEAAELDEALAEPGTVLLLVVGAGADCDRTERRCRDLALDPGFEEVRVVRVRDRSELTTAQRTAWLKGNRKLTLVDASRRVAVPLERADAVDLFVAVAALA